MTRKVEECLQNIALGLAANTGLTLPPLLIFVHGVISLSIPELKLPALKLPEDPLYSATGKPLKADSLILAPAPKRKVAAAAQPSVAAASKSAYITNSHLVVEFGLLLLSLLLKREKTHENAAAEILPMLDPIVPILHNNLSDPHSKVSLKTCNFLAKNHGSFEIHFRSSWHFHCAASALSSECHYRRSMSTPRKCRLPSLHCCTSSLETRQAKTSRWFKLLSR